MTADLAAIARGLATLAALRVASVALEVATACAMNGRQADIRGYAQGGFVTGSIEQRITVERVGTCPAGHPWFRLGGSPYVEHIATTPDWSLLNCPYRVNYQPREDT